MIDKRQQGDPSDRNAGNDSVELEEEQSQEGEENSDTRHDGGRRAAIHLHGRLITNSIGNASTAIDHRGVHRSHTSDGYVAVSVRVLLVGDRLAILTGRSNLEPVAVSLAGLADVLVVRVDHGGTLAARALRVLVPHAHAESQSGCSDQSQQENCKSQLHSEREG